MAFDHISRLHWIGICYVSRTFRRSLGRSDPIASPSDCLECAFDRWPAPSTSTSWHLLRHLPHRLAPPQPPSPRRPRLPSPIYPSCRRRWPHHLSRAASPPPRFRRGPSRHPRPSPHRPDASAADHACAGPHLPRLAGAEILRALLPSSRGWSRDALFRSVLATQVSVFWSRCWRGPMWPVRSIAGLMRLA